MNFRRILVTGGAGFMGSAFIRFGLKHFPACERMVNLDLLTYAGNLENCADCEHDKRYLFVQGDIGDQALVEEVCRKEKIEAIVHFAAESHVDRSITGPKTFLNTNVLGTFSLLEVVRRLPSIHFHHISTDEVYGSLEEEGFFSESSSYAPNSPYAASKAASDHFVRAYAHTYGISTTISHSCNNYGPRQFPEKLIPRMIDRCLQKLPLPLYGTGLNRREWLFVDDHAEAVFQILQKGKPGAVYNVGSGEEKSNLTLVHLLIDELAKQRGEDPASYRSLITLVDDRPGHDFRYALECTKLRSETGWSPQHTFEAGLAKTVAWYLQKEGALCAK